MAPSHLVFPLFLVCEQVLRRGKRGFLCDMAVQRLLERTCGGSTVSSLLQSLMCGDQILGTEPLAGNGFLGLHLSQV